MSSNDYDNNKIHFYSVINLIKKIQVCHYLTLDKGMSYSIKNKLGGK